MQSAHIGVGKTREFFFSLGMPQCLDEVGIAENQLEEIARKVVRFGAIGTLKELAFDDVMAILRAAR